MNETEVRALAREEILRMLEMAHWYTDGYGDLKGSAAYVLSDAADMVAEKMLPPAPEPVNPFAPKHTAQEWADLIKNLIQQAEADGAELWVDVEFYEGPGPKIRIGPPDSTGADDPIIWGDDA